MVKEVEALSKYTTEVRYLCEMEAGLDKSYGYKKVDDIIQAAIPRIFDFDFPVYDESYRNVLCTKILRHFYTREIGEETYGLWKLRLETKLNEIMPYYNKLYKSGLDEFNPLWDTQMKTTYQGGKESGSEEKEGIGETETGKDTASKTTTDSREVTAHTQDSMTGRDDSRQTDSQQENSDAKKIDQYSDTPQGGLEGMIGGDYLTNARIIDDTGVKTATGDSQVQATTQRDSNSAYNSDESGIVDENETVNRSKGREIDRDKKINAKSTEDYVLEVAGRNGGDVGKMLEVLKSELLNIDMMVISDLEPLFMCIW